MKTHYYTDEILDICYLNHLTVEEIYAQIIKKFPDAGKSSIYRNVEELAKRGELKKILGIGKKAYFEKNIGKHIHLVDIKTGRIDDIDEGINISSLPKGFKVSDIDVKVFGEFI